MGPLYTRFIFRGFTQSIWYRKIHTSPFPPIKVSKIDVYSLVFPDDSIEDRYLNKTALIDGKSESRLTYNGLLQDVKLLSTALSRRFHFKDGDVMCIYSPNHIQYPTSILAGLRIGGIVSPSNFLYTSDELAYQLKDSKAKILITCLESLETAQDAAQTVGMPLENIILLGSTSVNINTSIQDLINWGQESPLVARKEYTQREIGERPAFLCYSSGTTGLPKGVQTTHDNIVFNCYQTQCVERYDSAQILIGTLPFYHIYPLQAVITWGLFQRVSIVVQPRFNLDMYLSYIEKYKATIIHVVPPICIEMAKDPIVEKYDLSSLKMAVCAAAPMGESISKAFLEKVGIPVKQTYGMTELSPLCLYTPTEKIVDGSVGVLLPNQEAKIINPTGQEVEFGEAGELCIRGRNVMKGYLNNAKATKNTIDSDGFLHTGDVAVCRADGYFFIVDRLKELVKYKGHGVVPAELESLLISHPGIADAVIVGRPDEYAGELPMAFVVLQDGYSLSESEIQEFVSQRVNSHKKLRGGVEFINKIPKSASGKILRRLLRERLKQ